MFLNNANKSVQVKEGHYFKNLPFKAKSIKMPSNRGIAQQHLQSLKKYKKIKIIKREYTEFLGEVIQKGFAKIVPPAQVNKTDGIYLVGIYLIMGYIIQKRKQLGLFLIVVRHFKETSFNSELLHGYKETNTLIRMLPHFQKEPVALMADKQAMFHQVEVMEFC